MENKNSTKNPIIGILACLTLITCAISIVTMLIVVKMQKDLQDTNKKVKEIHNQVVFEPVEVEWDYEDLDE